MKRAGKKGRQSTDHRGSPKGSARVAAGKRDASDAGGRFRFAVKRPVLRFVVTLALLMLVFNVVFHAWISEADFFNRYLSLNARISAAIVNALGEEATVTGLGLTSDRFSLQIKRGCDAIQASAFFVFAMLASPSAVGLLARVPYLLIGTLLLLAMNFVRIVSLYYIGVYYERAFDIMHIDVWQVVFIFVPLIMWITWARRAGREQSAVPDDVT